MFNFDNSLANYFKRDVDPTSLKTIILIDQNQTKIVRNLDYANQEIDSESFDLIELKRS
jgi:hypothetical protein